MNQQDMAPAHWQFWPPSIPHEIEIGDRTLWDVFDAQASRAPAGLAVEFVGLTLRWDGLRRETLRLAGALQSLGVKPGDRVALFMQNCPHYVIAFHAILRCGAVAVPINPMNKSHELAHCLMDSGARLAVASADIAGEFGPALAEAQGRALLEHLVVFSTGDDLADADQVPSVWREWLCTVRPLPVIQGIGVHRWGDLLARDLVPAMVDGRADDLALLMYTSGTTGNPKACMHSHRTLLANAMQPALWQDMRPGDVSLVALPLFHITGLVGGLLAAIHAGASIVLLPRWDRRVAAQAIVRHKVTHWTNIATMIVDLLSDPDLDQFDLTSLRYIGGGGASMPQPVADKLKSLYGLDYIEAYGLTETAAPSHSNPRNAPRFQCLGIPIINTRACVMNPDTHQRAAIGEQGEILVAGPQVFLGYWNNPQATQEAFIELEGQRWFRTGDLGHVDVDGYYYIADRLKRMINASGFKVWPAEVEGLLHQHPAIQEVCVIARSDPYRGQSVKALIVLRTAERGRVQPADIIAWARANMAAYKVPKDIELVETLPKSGTGKVMWRMLQARQDQLDHGEPTGA